MTLMQPASSSPLLPLLPIVSALVVIKQADIAPRKEIIDQALKNSGYIVVKDLLNL